MCCNILFNLGGENVFVLRNEGERDGRRGGRCLCPRTDSRLPSTRGRSLKMSGVKPKGTEWKIKPCKSLHITEFICLLLVKEMLQMKFHRFFPDPCLASLIVVKNYLIYSLLLASPLGEHPSKSKRRPWRISSRQGQSKGTTVDGQLGLQCPPQANWWALFTCCSEGWQQGNNESFKSHLRPIKPEISMVGTVTCGLSRWLWCPLTLRITVSEHLTPQKSKSRCHGVRKSCHTEMNKANLVFLQTERCKIRELQFKQC